MSDDIQFIPLSAIVESPTNPRKTHRETGLQQLAESIKQVGVMQPIMVRPISALGEVPTRYEIVFGHRRFRASQMAGAEAIRAMVREMDDDDVKIAQLIENVQREDVNPVEEADGFVALHRQHNVSADEIAAQTGLGRTTVYDRMKLARSHDDVRKACLEEALPADIGVAIASLPMAIQPKALDEVRNPNGDDPWLSVREAKRIIKAGFTVSLKDAIFDLHQADMVTGACDGCSKRSDNDESYLEQLGPDVCTDKACFKTKDERHVQAQIEQAEAQGHAVVKGDAAKRIQSPYASHPIGHTMLDAVAFTEKAADSEDEKPVTYRELIDRSAEGEVKPILLVNPQRTALAPAATLDLITHEQAKALKEQFAPQASTADSQDGEDDGDSDDDDGDDDEEEDEVDTRPPEVQAVEGYKGWQAILRAIMASLRKVKRAPDELRLVILALMYGSDEVPQLVAEEWGWVDEIEALDTPYHSDFVRGKMEAMSPDDLAALMVAMALDVHPTRYNAEGIMDKLAMAGAYGIDVVKVSGWKPPARQAALELAPAPVAAKPSRPGQPSNVKYRNPMTGETWTGRGLQPKWVQVAIAGGKTLADLEVERAAA